MRHTALVMSGMAMAGLVLANPAGADEAEDRIRERVTFWEEGVAMREIDMIMDIYVEDIRVMPPGSPPLDGHDAVRGYWGQLLAMPDLSLDIEPDTITVAESGEMAVVVGSWRLAFGGPDGPVEDRGSFMDVWMRSGETWRVRYDIINSDLPMQ